MANYRHLLALYDPKHWRRTNIYSPPVELVSLDGIGVHGLPGHLEQLLRPDLGFVNASCSVLHLRVGELDVQLPRDEGLT